MSTFKHSGDVGDIIYALAVIKALGGGKLFLSRSPYTRLKPNQRTVSLLAPLMEQLEYIHGIELYTGQPVKYDLDRWRYNPNSFARWDRSLAEMHAMAFDLPMEIFNEPWIPRPCKPGMNGPNANHRGVTIARSPRYHNPNFPWKKVLEKYKQARFVGLDEEHEAFENEFGEIPHKKTDDFEELRHVIGTSALFIGNQSSPYALAEAMKMPVIQETWLDSPNCMFDREMAIQVAGDTVQLPTFDPSGNPVFLLKQNYETKAL